MSNPQIQNKQQAVVQAKRTVQDLINSDRAKLEIAKVLPKHLTPERMTRVALTATLKNPALLDCSPESLMNALLVCSQAGLEPDGRLAHLIPYGKVCQVIFDYKGLVTLALRNGAESVFADKVCEHDFFEAGVADGKKVLNHKPNWRKDRGTPICYYAICKRAGEVDWEVMSVEEVESVRKRSRATNNGPWVTDFDEMGKKTVLRRMSKRWDLLPEIRDVINADDDTPPPLNALTISRPMFNEPKPITDAKQEPPAPESESPQADAPADETPPVIDEPRATGPQGNAYNPLKALRSLLKLAKIKESELLDFWAGTGASDGSQSSLEEVQIALPQLVTATCEKWGEFSATLLAQKRKVGGE